MEHLNPEQQAVVLQQGHCLAIACPGSGKTSTLASKAAYLLEHGARVGAVTFTRDAALELRERIVQQAPHGNNSHLLVGTFHSIAMLMAFPKRAKSSFGNAILREIKTPFKDAWKIAPNGVQVGYVLRAIRECGLAIDVKEALSIVETFKATGSTKGLDDSTQDMVAMYVHLMEGASLIDFQDIILRTNAALQNGSLSTLPVDFLLVDEFQDTDQNQYEWVRAHGEAGVSLTAVGDDDQSIYAFRRALGYDVMDKFANEFRAARILLGTNYRCKKEILETAERLILKNTQRIEKRLYAESGQGGVVLWENFTSSLHEASAVAEEAFVAMNESASFAVIARTHRELLDIQKALLLRNIPYKRAEGESLFDRLEVQVFAATLRTLLEPVPNDIDLIVGWAGMSDSDAQSVRRLVSNKLKNHSLRDFQPSTLTEEGKKIWRSFTKKHGEWSDLLTQNSHSLLMLGICEWLLDSLQKPHSIDVLEAAASLFHPGEKALDKHLAALKAIDALSKDNSGQPDNSQFFAYLITAHGAKGLEFDRVWIVGMKHGAFPSEKGSLEEERRLMYVAMTRAREYLWLSAVNDKSPSVFVYETGLLQHTKERRSC